jgi:hypothetical protein
VQLWGTIRWKQSFRDFDKFVRQAQSRALAEHRDFLLIWQKDGITLEPRVPSAEDGEGEVDMYSGEWRGDHAGAPGCPRKEAIGEWPIWRSGTCEPVRITYKRDGLGFWVAEYDPLTARSRLITLEQE